MPAVVWCLHGMARGVIDIQWKDRKEEEGRKTERKSEEEGRRSFSSIAQCCPCMKEEGRRRKTPYITSSPFLPLLLHLAFSLPTILPACNSHYYLFNSVTLLLPVTWEEEEGKKEKKKRPVHLPSVWENDKHCVVYYSSMCLVAQKMTAARRKRACLSCLNSLTKQRKEKSTPARHSSGNGSGNGRKQSGIKCLHSAWQRKEKEASLKNGGNSI